MFVIHNPIAGARKTGLLWAVVDRLTAHGIRVELAQTNERGDATRFAREAAGRGVRVVVAAGGDGTAAEVASGISGTESRLGIIPLGTANVVATELGLPRAPDPIAAALASDRTRALWPGVARSDAGARMFVQMLGVGLDARVVHTMPRRLKTCFGRHAYLLHTLSEMVRYPYAPVRVRIDGREHEAGSVVVSKGRFYGGHYMLAPEADASRRGFSVALFRRRGPGAVLMYGAALMANALPRAPGFDVLRSEEVEILPSFPAQADGDPAGSSPLVVEDARGPIPVLCC